LLTKGDNNPTVDPWTIHDEHLVGKVVDVNPIPAIVSAVVLPTLTLWIVVIVVLAVLSAVLIALASLRSPSPPDAGAQALQESGAATSEDEDYFCRYCGAANENDAVYCEKCGRRLRKT
jgi:hypothetical protein